MAASPILVADIGATNARFGLIDGRMVREARVLRCADYASIEDAATAYLAAVGLASPGTPGRPRRGAFAVAGPVTGDHIAMTNLVWQFSVGRVRDAWGWRGWSSSTTSPPSHCRCRASARRTAGRSARGLRSRGPSSPCWGRAAAGRVGAGAGGERPLDGAVGRGRPCHHGTDQRP
ncbi:glucokinase [Azospirillum sp. INR13]|uniref:glucokinase n=1 Tax=Azospirillum sp. INR13 TaxID=2596919 RepID=UPI00351CAFDB